MISYFVLDRLYGYNIVHNCIVCIKLRYSLGYNYVNNIIFNL